MVSPDPGQTPFQKKFSGVVGTVSGGMHAKFEVCSFSTFGAVNTPKFQVSRDPGHTPVSISKFTYVCKFWFILLRCCQVVKVWYGRCWFWIHASVWQLHRSVSIRGCRMRVRRRDVIHWWLMRLVPVCKMDSRTMIISFNWCTALTLIKTRPSRCVCVT